MIFGPVPLETSQGAVLAHSLSVGTLRLKKGHVLNATDVMLLSQSGIIEVIVARLQEGDVGEDAAAEALARAFAGAHIRAANASTGRVNLHAKCAGMFRAERLLVDHFNGIDPAITFACLADQTPVQPGEMVATIKIIPLAVAGASLKQAQSAISARNMAHVLPFKPVRAGLIATMLPTLKPTVMDKTRALLAGRLAVSGSSLNEESRVAHDVDAVSAEIVRMAGLYNLIVVFGASAVTDPDDVVPAAIRKAGGRVERVGMPVDPGNLLVLGSVGEVPVIGAPGCARSPKENGFDWVLARILSGQTPTALDITRMGVGGLLTEIATRPQPRQPVRGRDENRSAVPVGVVVLAAGRASRMGEGAGHKLLAEFDGEALIRRMARTALASKVAATIVVTGHRGEDIAAELEGLDVQVAANPEFASGMASSLQRGLGSLDDTIAGALVLLGDMPALRPEHLNALIERFAKSNGLAIVRACDGERRGNPVILPRAAFADVMQLSGDVGARALIESGAWPVIDVEIGPAARIDVDTPEAVQAAGGVTETPARD
ncbi:MAG: molybdopterin-binding/glycosyltransferase family 2 protein [Hoeflea sp.]|uniref:molybdopterin-binding/glycosyltransferase family 2 protein n=1 Tax=Hoeflea sp. TaxID=1940281 RepID=UPI001D1EAD53|nr:molybdopterin-binding/glycosyltransferase family 2 protein [Hoeflea sp.]MBU4530371.1 molybdopterin-binding/glycosyltransferase family 2 protein [Alphaproteobacteria bacterium]MBU4545158.1 molybdopterin-binding/glycosyltransferase family 2 protein [Alphaproteobacteria bacterium]MBU4549642.1 molybdopterin-binding/glycosyltransferase family 2 protein [Alphaproteobacteria bacterium]MBV1721961.1 molybdopterin-binding/glycosyltransferase family 2 protein [Hoeflea sp.]MBV1761311.1 molybdopterin-bi